MALEDSVDYQRGVLSGLILKKFRKGIIVEYGDVNGDGGNWFYIPSKFYGKYRLAKDFTAAKDMIENTIDEYLFNIIVTE